MLRALRKTGPVAALPLWLLGAARAAAGAPDLVVASVDASGVATDCRSLEIAGVVTVRVENRGDAPAGPFGLVLFEDRTADGLFTGDADPVLGAGTVDEGVGPGEGVELQLEVRGTVPFRGSLIHAAVDPGQQVTEADEANNAAHSGAGCLAAPSPGAFSPVEEWNWRSSETLSGHVQVMMTPLVASLTDDNGDGRIDDRDVPDVIFSAFRGRAYDRDSVVRAVRGDDGSEIFTTPLAADRDVMQGSLAAGDIDGDGLVEIVAGEDTTETHDINRYGRVIVFEHDGSYKLTSDLIPDGVGWGGAALADLNGDGVPEIVLGRHVLAAGGRLLASGSSRSGVAHSLAADIDRDGRPEIVAGFTAYEVEVDAANAITALSVQWEARDGAGSQVAGDGFPAVADFDGDEQAEVVVVSAGSVWLFDDDGSWIWGPSPIPGGGHGGPPNVDDFDSDGQVEVGTAGRSRYAVFDTDGALLWTSPTFDTSSEVTGSSVFDFEGDGSAEVVYKDQTYLRIYRGTDGQVLWSVATGSGTLYENPVVADVDRDGNAEIIVCANNYAYGSRTGIQVFGDARDNWVDTRRIWNQHTYHITNVNDDGTIPAVEESNWLRFNSFRSQEGADRAAILAAPDLTVSFLRVATGGCPQASGVTVRVGNGGANVAAAPVRIAFYDGAPAGGSLLGVAETSRALEPGDSEDVTLEVRPPLEGPRTLTAVADDDGSGAGLLNECDEENNLFTATVSHFCREEFRRGDSDMNGSLELLDAVFTLGCLFQARPCPVCLDAADTDDGGTVNVVDAIYGLRWEFLGAAPPPPPGREECGVDPSPDGLPRCSYELCREISCGPGG